LLHDQVVSALQIEEIAGDQPEPGWKFKVATEFFPEAVYKYGRNIYLGDIRKLLLKEVFRLITVATTGDQNTDLFVRQLIKISLEGRRNHAEVPGGFSGNVSVVPAVHIFIC